MAKPSVYTWPAANTTSVALLQILFAAGNLSINGSLSSNYQPSYNTFFPSTPGITIVATTSSVIFSGISRTITLTSLNNLSGVNFTIRGMLNGVSTSEVLVGPDNNTVTSVNIYDSILSISTDAAAAGISAGTGATGMTHWFNSNYNSTVFGMTIQVVVVGAITYTFQTTLDDVNNPAPPHVFTPIGGMTAATTSQMIPYNSVARYSNIIITASAGGSLVATFLQQGIT